MTRAGLRPELAKISRVCALVALTGCSFLRDTPTPIPTLVSPVSATGRAATLVVFLLWFASF